MALKKSGRRKFSKLMAHHIFGDIYWNELSAIVHGKGMTNHFREDGGSPRPSFNHLTVLGKKKRQGKFVGRRASWKKAIITLHEGEKVELYESA